MTIKPDDIISLLPAQVFWMNREGVYLGANQAVLDFLNLKDKQEIIGKTVEIFADRQPAEAIKNIREQNESVVRTGKTIKVENVGFDPQGNKAYYLVDKMPIRDPDTQEIMGVLGVGVNITDRKKIEEELKQAKEQAEHVYQAESESLRNLYRSISGQRLPEGATAEKTVQKIWHYIENLIYQVPAGLFWMDKEGYYLGCNEIAESFSPTAKRELVVGKRNVEIFPPDIAELLDKNNKKVLESGKTHFFEEYGYDIHGNRKYYLSHKAPIKDNETGEVIGLIGATLDITERKAMEQALAKAKEDSEAANFAKSHFLNNMRHDIRTPLSCIVGSARVLKKMEHDPEKLEFIDGILDCSESLLSMITHMLEYDTLAAKERPVKLEIVKIKKLSRDLLLMVSLAAKRKGIDIELNIADDVPEYVETDTYRIQRILLNLMTNAIKFTDKGMVALNVAVKQQDMKLLALNIAVHDTGIGIPKDKHNVIFDKFVRLNTIEKNVESGEGLGLSIVRQYVNELSGSIAVSSTLGEGSTFYLTVPCRHAAVTQKENAL